MNRPTTPPATDRALRGRHEAPAEPGTDALSAAIRRAARLEARERDAFMAAALRAAEARGDHGVLTTLLDLGEQGPDRSAVLEVVVRVADELAPRFAELIGALRDGERTLVLGTLLQASRLDPNPERRLLRLARLLRVLPPASRALYWPEAEALAALGGDDAQLALVGIARGLPAASRQSTLTSLRRAAGRVDHAFKRALALVALAELTAPSRTGVREAAAAARRVPDLTLRILVHERIAQIDGHGSG